MDRQKVTINLHQKQFDAYNFTKQFGACICGVQSGKTFLGATWALKQITKFPKGNGLIAAPTVKILQQSTLDKFFTLFPEYRKYYREQKGLIELPEGGKIFIRSTDDPLGIEGMTINWAWLDEAGMMKRMIWAVIKARVSTTNGQVLFTTTPYNLGWLYQEIYIPWKEGREADFEVFTWKSVENPYFSQEYYDKEKVRMTPQEFARRYEGEFTRLEGLVWEIGSEAVLDQNQALQKVLAYPDRMIGGIDWGYHNPSGILVIAIKDGTYYVVDEWKQAEKTTTEILEQAQAFQKQWGVNMWYPDPAEPDRIEEFKRKGLRIGTVNKDVALGISEVASLIRLQRLFIHKRCKELLDEVNQYRYDTGEDGKPFKESPIKVNDHLCDALRYAVMGFRVNAPTPKLHPVDILLNTPVFVTTPTIHDRARQYL